MFLIACMCNQSGAAMDDEDAVAVDCASVEATECKHNSSKDLSECKQLLEPSDCWAAALLRSLATVLLCGHGSVLLHGLSTAYYDQGLSALAADPSNATADVRGLSAITMACAVGAPTRPAAAHFARGGQNPLLR